ncbi:24463_t:CDS:2 [Entrophospora sp. SA101]|nr:12720_t:CDS:2 [Entrophospora sp. SA101]CAJ0748226.1 24463_t:CDS:2 [Entrophospora sp. SA101]CAJ0826918.1 3872_t:CDS:2 [Entrophospora sp. SA101]
MTAAYNHISNDNNENIPSTNDYCNSSSNNDKKTGKYYYKHSRVGHIPNDAMPDNIKITRVGMDIGVPGIPLGEHSKHQQIHV